jgi:hemerythrin-like domain-containing protein
MACTTKRWQLILKEGNLMNALEILKQDHRGAMSLIKLLEASDEGATDEVFNKLKGALMLHTQMEERHLYPALESQDETRDLILESYQAHSRVDELLAEMGSLESSDFKESLNELKSAIESHVDEEENELFPKAQLILGADRLQEIGRQMKEMKKQASVAAKEQ